MYNHDQIQFAFFAEHPTANNSSIAYSVKHQLLTLRNTNLIP